MPRSAVCLQSSCDSCKFKFRCYVKREVAQIKISDISLYCSLTGDKAPEKSFTFGEWILVQWRDCQEPIWYIVTDSFQCCNDHEVRAICLGEYHTRSIHLDYIIARGGVNKPIRCSTTR